MEGPDIGHVVYFIACGHYVKVGYSSDVRKRMASMQTANPQELYLVMTIGFDDEPSARVAEREWREKLTACGKPARGEWVELEYEVIGILVAARQPIRAVHISELLAREYRSTDEQILEEQLRGRCRLRARLS